jgi:hypothetical protein
MLELERFAILLIDICLLEIYVNKNLHALSDWRRNLAAQVSILRPGMAWGEPLECDSFPKTQLLFSVIVFSRRSCSLRVVDSR